MSGAAGVLEGGFADAATDAARAFRAALDAMAHPGRIATVGGVRPPAGLSVAAAVLVLTLADPATPLHLAGSADTAAIRDWVRFHTGAPLGAPRDAVLALGPWDALRPLDRFSLGLPAWPDRSATIIAELPRLAAEGARLTGPGIRGTARLSLPETAAFRANRAQFPLGLDFFFTAGDRLAALPRSTRVEAG